MELLIFFVVVGLLGLLFGGLKGAVATLRVVVILFAVGSVALGVYCYTKVKRQEAQHEKEMAAMLTLNPEFDARFAAKQAMWQNACASGDEVTKKQMLYNRDLGADNYGRYDCDPSWLPQGAGAPRYESLAGNRSLDDESVEGKQRIAVSEAAVHAEKEAEAKLVSECVKNGLNAGDTLHYYTNPETKCPASTPVSLTAVAADGQPAISYGHTTGFSSAWVEHKCHEDYSRTYGRNYQGFVAVYVERESGQPVPVLCGEGTN